MIETLRRPAQMTPAREILRGSSPLSGGRLRSSEAAEVAQTSWAFQMRSHWNALKCSSVQHYAALFGVMRGINPLLCGVRSVHDRPEPGTGSLGPGLGLDTWNDA